MKQINPNLIKLAEQTYNPELEIDESVLEETKEPIKKSGEFTLEDLTDFYRINGVNYRDNIYTVDLSKALLSGKTQEQHAEHRKEAITNNEFYTQDYPLFHSMITALKENKDGQYRQKIGEVRQFIKDLALKYWLMTLTRIQYNPNGKDTIIHNYKQQDKYEAKIDFIGPDGYITNKKTGNVIKPLQALLNTKQSIQEINNAYKWLTDVDTYLWRINSKPGNIYERIARFSIDSGRAYLYCGRNPEYSYSSLGVRAAKSKG